MFTATPIVLVMPQWISIAKDEFVNIHALNSRRLFDAFLFAVDEDDHGLLAAFFASGFLGFGQFAFRHRHDPCSVDC